LGSQWDRHHRYAAKNNLMCWDFRLEASWSVICQSCYVVVKGSERKSRIHIVGVSGNRYVGFVLRLLPAAELAHFFSSLSSQPAKSSTNTALVFFYRYGADFSREVSYGGIMGIS
jgi:hypothetical protein